MESRHYTHECNEWPMLSGVYLCQCTKVAQPVSLHDATEMLLQGSR